MHRNLLNGDPSIDDPFHRGGMPSATRNNASVARRYPPELTGDPHTDWVLWGLSLTLADIARNSLSPSELQSPSQEEAQCDRR